jgi:hypothetical protein
MKEEVLVVVRALSAYPKAATKSLKHWNWLAPAQCDSSQQPTLRIMAKTSKSTDGQWGRGKLWL